MTTKERPAVEVKERPAVEAKERPTGRRESLSRQLPVSYVFVLVSFSPLGPSFVRRYFEDVLRYLLTESFLFRWVFFSWLEAFLHYVGYLDSLWDGANFNGAWTSDVRFKDWLAPVEGRSARARCRLCAAEFDVSNMGMAALVSHKDGKPKKKKIESTLGSSRL